jgi:hypothetical protein
VTLSKFRIIANIAKICIVSVFSIDQAEGYENLLCNCLIAKMPMLSASLFSELGEFLNSSPFFNEFTRKITPANATAQGTYRARFLFAPGY